MGRRHATTLFLLLLSLGLFVTTYNSIMMTAHLKRHDKSNYLKSGNSKFHIAVTSESTTYCKWQMRVMYYWYKKQKDLPGSDMGKFTRILHSGAPDNLMDEIPTVVVYPLPNGWDKNYVVLNRPWAFMQWIEVATIDEEYILMAEPDHIFTRPLPNLVSGELPVGFPFFYIKPSKHERIIRKFYPEEKGPLTDIDPIGNSPVIIQKDLLKKITPTWLNMSLRIKYDQEADKALGWVQEMYAYAIASAMHGVRHLLREDFMIQPPWDLKMGNSFILHFTYQLDYTKGKLTFGVAGDWGFNKRTYLNITPPRDLPLPPPGVPESVVTLIKMINEATANLPSWDYMQ
ncbi:unnamed protein product [Cuscuta epithymum]|uniref:Hydroxyproline O-arabinosyltransferase-like domain-containing protein n=2 Tax=Cuscuta epithymum TaxID=186058 RepID=A0AAV0CTJ8_9ASTE|nr:unnamed protein product [Cuscuta epithymum]